MTNRPVPPRRPWFRRCARWVSVPGLSLAYQLRISRTRSVMADSSSAPVGAVPAAAARSVAPESILAHELVTEPVELVLLYPANLERVDLGVAMEAAPALRAALVEVDVGQHVPPAERAAGHREARRFPAPAADPRDAHEDATSRRRPMSVSSRRMCA